jgi:NADH-ubiquinone oxidoreductase chain 4
MIVAHGVCSSGMFCAVNIYYERSGRRGFYINKGLISFMPVFTLIVFMLCAANIAAPPTINLLSEIFLIGRIMKYDYIILLAFPLGSYFGAVFTLFLFRYSQHGKYYEGGQVGSAINYREFHLMVLHLLPLNVLVLKPDFFLYIY